MPEGIKLGYRPGCMWTQESAIPFSRAEMKPLALT